jgi:hypothetical protein
MKTIIASYLFWTQVEAAEFQEMLGILRPKAHKKEM